MLTFFTIPDIEQLSNPILKGYFLLSINSKNDFTFLLGF